LSGGKWAQLVVCWLFACGELHVWRIAAICGVCVMWQVACWPLEATHLTELMKDTLYAGTSTTRNSSQDVIFSENSLKNKHNLKSPKLSVGTFDWFELIEHSNNWMHDIKSHWLWLITALQKQWNQNLSSYPAVLVSVDIFFSTISCHTDRMFYMLSLFCTVWKQLVNDMQTNTDVSTLVSENEELKNQVYYYLLLLLLRCLSYTEGLKALGITILKTQDWEVTW